MTRSERPGRRPARGRFVALAAGAGALAAAAALSAAACLDDLPPGTFGADAGADASDAVAPPAPVCGDGILQRDAGESCDPGDSGAPGCDPQTCTVVCLDGGFVGPTNDHCYFPLSAAKDSLDAALGGCAVLGAHPVSYDGPGEQQLVDDHFGDGGGPYWLALQLVTPVDVKPIYDQGLVNEPGWRSTCSGCYGPTLTDAAVEFVDVCKPGAVVDCVAHGPGSPAYFGFACDGTCGASSPAGAAGSTVHALCEREPPGLSAQPCDDGGVCITLKATASFYELVLDPLTRPAAAAACTSKTGPGGARGHLVVFQTAEERAQLSGELVARTQPGAPQLEYWVGLSNDSTSSTPTWKWEDGTPDDGTYPLEWADGEPSPPTYPWAFGLVDVELGDTFFDRQLLRADTGAVTRPFVCEFDGPDGGTP